MLKTKQVEINGTTYTVSQAGMIEASRKVIMATEIQNIWDELSEEMRMSASVWVRICGCITPKITWNQFLQLPESEIDLLAIEAKELNPSWFPDVEGAKKN